MNIETVIYVERFDPKTNADVELEIEIKGTCSTYVPARITGPYELCSPAEGGEIELTEFQCTDQENGHLFTGLSKDEMNKAIEALREASYEEDEEPEYEEDYD